jgi:GT2 family glycosyltransferase
MSDETQAKPTKGKSAQERKRQIEQAKAKLAVQDETAVRNLNPIVLDETYGELRQENRVVMRHNIALQIDNFRAAPETFAPRPAQSFPSLRIAATPFFSVIIPNYNGRRLLPAALDALRRQSCQDFEVILADDASSDDSVAFVEQHYPEVRLLVNRRNIGFAKNCNAAADAARGRILVLLNSDTEPESDWLAELLQAIVANPQATIIASKLLLFDQRHKLHSAGDMLAVDGTPQNRGVWQEDLAQFDQATAIFSGCGAAVAYRKEAWQALGGFDEDFWMYLEDVDYAFRVHLAGGQAIFAPRARVYHRLTASAGDTLASYYVGRNTVWLLAKNMPRGLLLRNLPQIIAAQLGVTFDALRNWRGAAARARLRGQLDGLFGLPAQLRKRRLIQARRQIENRELAARFYRI